MLKRFLLEEFGFGRNLEVLDFSKKKKNNNNIRRSFSKEMAASLKHD